MMLKLVYPGQFSDLLIICVHKIVFFHGGGSGTAYCLTFVGGRVKLFAYCLICVGGRVKKFAYCLISVGGGG